MTGHRATSDPRTARRRRGRPLATAAAATVLAVTATVTAAVATAPAAGATPSLADARHQAAALRAAVDRLQIQAEQASEAYDAAQEQLGAAVQRYLAADQELDVARAASTAQLSASAARVHALYESGGSVGLYAAVLDGASITEALERVQLARAVIADSRAQVATAGNTLAHLTTLHDRLGRLADQRTRLQAGAAAKAATVRDLLARQQDMLAAADVTVRDLVAEQQRAQAQAAAAAFAERLDAARTAALAAGGPVGGSVATTPVAAAAIAAARTRLGVPYVWGGTGPDAFDCSGLTGWAYAQAGIHLPRTAAEQWYAGPHPDLAQLQPGDLLFWATDPRDPATIHHVALYIGAGLMIAAPHTGDVVRVQRVYLDGFIGAVRPSGTAG